MSEWKECKLENVLVFGNGKVRPTEKGYIPVYGGNGILDYGNNYNYSEETIIIGRVGAYCGAVYYENRPVWISDNALSAKPKDNNVAKFFYYYLNYLGLNQFAEGSSHPLVTQKLLNSIDIEIPNSIPEQKAIAEVLSSLDDKIDLLHRQNKTLESMAEALFRKWFVEETDEHWEERIIDNIVSIKGGTTPSTKDATYWDGNIYWSTPKDLSNKRSVYLFDTERKITEKGLLQISSGMLPKGVVLLSSRAPIGYLAIAEISTAINQGYIAIICDKFISNFFMYLWCKYNMEEIKNSGNGSVFQEISKGVFKQLRVLIPPEEYLYKFDKIVEPIFEKIKSNQIQIRTLEKLRDTLLPKLMSGEVRVSV